MSQALRFPWPSLLIAALFVGTSRAQAEGEPDSGRTSAAEALRKDFLDLLTEDEPAARAREAAALARSRDASLDAWEAALRDLGRPPLPLDDLASHGGFVRRVRLWCAELGLCDVEVHGFLPRAERPARGHALLLACHGTGGSGAMELSIWRRFAEQVPLIVLAPTEPGENVGYRFSEAERQVHLSLLRWALLHLPVDRDRVFVCGTSRGGHAAWDLALRHPDPWAGILPCIGSPRLSLRGGQNNLRLLENVVHLPIRDLQGSKDDPMMIWSLRLAFRELDRLGATQARFVEFPELGHWYSFEGTDVLGVLQEARRDPRPTDVRLAACRLREARRAWIRIAAFDRQVEDEVLLRVQPQRWSRMDPEQQRLFAHGYARDRTARLTAVAARDDAVLRIRVESERVRRIAIELPRWLWTDPPPARLLVRLEGRERLLVPKADVALFLERMAEHLDLDRAPVAVAEL